MKLSLRTRRDLSRAPLVNRTMFALGLLTELPEPHRDSLELQEILWMLNAPDNRLLVLGRFRSWVAKLFHGALLYPPMPARTGVWLAWEELLR